MLVTRVFAIYSKFGEEYRLTGYTGCYQQCWKLSLGGADGYSIGSTMSRKKTPPSYAEPACVQPITQQAHKLYLTKGNPVANVTCANLQGRAPAGPVMAEDHAYMFPFFGPAEDPSIAFRLISASSFCMRFELALITMRDASACHWRYRYRGAWIQQYIMDSLCSDCV